MRKKIVPGEPWVASGGLYDRWDYLRDAFTGWRHYWSKDLHSYFDGFESTTRPSFWEQAGTVLEFVVSAGLVVLIIWLLS